MKFVEIYKTENLNKKKMGLHSPKIDTFPNDSSLMKSDRLKTKEKNKNKKEIVSLSRVFIDFFLFVDWLEQKCSYL